MGNRGVWLGYLRLGTLTAPRKITSGGEKPCVLGCCVNFLMSYDVVLVRVTIAVTKHHD